MLNEANTQTIWSFIQAWYTSKYIQSGIQKISVCRWSFLLVTVNKIFIKRSDTKSATNTLCFASSFICCFGERIGCVVKWVGVVTSYSFEPKKQLFYELRSNLPRASKQSYHWIICLLNPVFYQATSFLLPKMDLANYNSTSVCSIIIIIYEFLPKIAFSIWATAITLLN